MTRLIFFSLILVSFFQATSMEGQKRLIPSSFDCAEGTYIYIPGQDTAYGYNPIVPNSTFPLATLCFGVGVAHNLGWYRFRLKSSGITTLSLSFDVGNCENGQGVQGGILSDCAGTETLDCDASCNTSTFSLTFNAEKLKDYVLWVDGCNGDVCQYDFVLKDNEFAPEDGFRPIGINYYLDVNENCNLDVNESDLLGNQTQFESTTQPIVYSVNIGQHGFAYLPFDEYNVTTSHQFLPLDYCPDDFLFTVDSMTQFPQWEIGGWSDDSCPFLAFNILPAKGMNRYRCDPINRKSLKIVYENQGISPTLSDSALLQLDTKYFSNSEFDHQFVKVDDVSFKIALNDLEIGERDTIEVTYILKCDVDDLGKEICVSIFDIDYACQPFITSNSEDHYCDKIRLAYDPNDIYVAPFGETENKYISKEQTLDYLIRFQNTGTDTAYRVLVELKTGEFDPASIIMGYSSHSTIAKYSIQPDSTIRFYLFDINLVDSTTNEAESHGYIKLKLRLNDPIFFEKINHSAEIIFDFNPAIQTNTDFHIIAPAYVKNDKEIHLCPGETLGDLVIDGDTAWIDTLMLPGPDSIISYDVFIEEEYMIQIDTTISAGDSILGVPVDTDTFIQKLFFTQWDCDSLVIYKITVNGTVSSTNVQSRSITLFPNPLIGNQLYVNNTSSMSGEAQIEFYNNHGRLLDIEKISDINSSIDMSDYNYKGLIYYKLTQQGSELETFGKLIRL